MEYTKKCVKCGENKKCNLDKSLTQFHYRNDTKKFRNDCIECRRNAQNEINKLNRKIIKWDMPMNIIDSINKKLLDPGFGTEDRSNLMTKLPKLYDEHHIENTHPYKETILMSSFSDSVPSDEAIKDRIWHHAAIRVHVFRRDMYAIRILCKQKLPDNIMDVICTPIEETKLPEPTDLYKKFLQEIRATQFGYVYFIVVPSTYNSNTKVMGNVKIGYTIDLASRLANGQVFNPEELVVYAAIQTRHYKDLEKFLHASCDHRHVRGEWYQLSLQEIDTITADFDVAGEIYESFLDYRKTSGTPNPLFLTTEQRIKRLEDKIKMLEQKT